MYPGKHAATRGDRAAIVMATSGETVTYAELDARSNRLAHFLRSRGLKRLDHYAIYLENHVRFIECCAAGERSGLYYTAANSYLKVDELAYILENCEAQVLITSVAKRDVALQAMARVPRVTMCLLVDGPTESDRIRNLDEAVGGFPDTPVADERMGAAMLYSSGTTGRPKGILRPLPDVHPGEEMPLFQFIKGAWQFRDGLVYLSPAPLYHAAPLAGIALTIRCGGTAVIMEHFDAAQSLELIPRHRVTHAQYVPTMFARMLKLPDEQRLGHDLSSLEVAIHGAAPCPPQVKRQMIEWWGPVVLEYYGMTEGMGISLCTSEEWLAHPGSVGRVALGKLHILDDERKPVPAGEVGTIWFELGSEFSYFNDAERTRDAMSLDGKMGTVGDVGYVDADGYLYLTDRATFMIVSGGVNIYPQECEDLLISHPKVVDAAVFGVPNEDLGEEVKAVIQPAAGVETGPDLAAELIAYCGAHLARQKVPRSVDFMAELPRLPTGKLYKRLLREPYWAGRKSRIV